MKKQWVFILSALMLLGISGCKKDAPAPEANAPADVKAVDEAQAPANPAAPAADPQKDPNDRGALPPPPPPVKTEIPAPADVAAPPADAQKTITGLAYKKLTANDTGVAITENDLVKVHYTGWTTDGHMFDTSELDQAPAVFTPAHLIAGMKEGLMLMKKGEKARFWVPEDLAYGGAPGRPAGMLVFDFNVLDVITPVMPPKDIPEDAVKLDNGLAYRITQTTPNARQLGERDLVTLEFSGWVQQTGDRFQTTAEMDAPIKAPIHELFPGWKTVLPNAHVGDTLQIWVPQELGITPNGELPGMLIFELKVVEAVAAPEPPKAPEDVATPNADAQKTESGIAWRITQKGTGTEHPTATSRVRVHYSGWTTDGQLFDSSVMRGEPAVFGLNQVIAGWTEALQLMVVGEKRILWIPENLAYKGMPGRPAGTLVFEVELLDILK